MLDVDLPHNGLPLLPPPPEVETRAILKRCIAAHKALAALKQAATLIPNATVLINSIPLLEAKSSSEIENIVTTGDALFRQASLMDGEADAGTKEALRYRTALLQGYQSLGERPLTLRTAVRVCQTLKGIEFDVRKTPGTKLRNHATGEVIYTPPEGESVLRDLLSNWERFLNATDDLDPLVRMAIGHYQFEAIHPFIDGNGRTGRILNILFLVQAGLLDSPTLYLSRYILDTRAEYYRLLQGVTRTGAWEPWIDYMLVATEATARWTLGKIQAIRALIEHTVEYIRAASAKIHSRELVDILFSHVYCRIANVVDAGIVQRHRASHYMKELIRIGVLTETKSGRDKLFVHQKYLALLIGNTNQFSSYTR